jgi:hypothetical protein
MRPSGIDTEVRGGRHFPDRSAYLHRRRAHRAFAVVAVLLLVLPWFGYRHVRDFLTGPRPPEEVAAQVAAGAGDAGGGIAPGPPSEMPGLELDPARTAAQLERIRTGTRAGDQVSVQAGVDALAEDVRRSMRLAERGSMVHREAARARVQAMPGVRAVGWIDRTHLLVVVARDDLHVPPMIDGVCAALRASGDPAGLVVHLQSGQAVRATRAGLLSRECGTNGAASPDAAAPPADDAAPHLVPEPAPPVDLEAHRRRNAESMRILEETTPEL